MLRAQQARHLWQLTAHYRSILEGHLISAARVRNSLELVLNSAVGRTEADEFICSLLCKQEVHSQRLADRCGVTVVGNAINNGSADVPVGGSKRKLAEILPKEGADESAAIEAVGVVGWAELLRQMEGEHGLVPVVKYIPHVPLMQVLFDAVFSACLFLVNRELVWFGLCIIEPDAPDAYCTVTL